MSEPTQTAAAREPDVLDNLLIRDNEPNPKSEIQNPQSYDASARNRFEFEMHHGGQTYDIAHIFGPLDDERYMQWNRDLNVRGDQDNVEEEAREASAALWDDIITEVEGVEYDEGADWKALIPGRTKVEAINSLLAVAIVEPDERAKANRKLRLGEAASRTVTTEAYFNGEIIQQQHVMQEPSFELEKKYERIQSKRLKQERTGGLRRKPRIEYVPQDEKLGGLYDEMCISTTGFAGGTPASCRQDVPLRFKTAVVHYLFAPTLETLNRLGK